MSKTYSYLGKLQKKKLLVKTKKRGLHAGSRQSARFGSSLEFSDFRAYQLGDDVRQIDWNVYGRTQKHYIKRFLDEQELSISIYLDGTASMQKAEKKWEMARELAAALSYTVLSSDDRLYFAAISGEYIQPVKKRGAIYSRKVFLDILHLQAQGVSGAFWTALPKVISKKEQLSVLISDGLEPLSVMEEVFQQLAALKQEFWLIQVLSSEELFPDYSGDLKLLDAENGTVVNVSMNSAILTEYKTRIRQHNKELESLCKKYGGHYLLAADDRDLQTILFTDLPAKGLMR
ncbi:DUF58 domain-containing protein [Cytobacillus gottheilii]|uniref:DUF58 domain-containing protein n=1 Tax=Cytobacillus gottheilii TaxID=859144 RepID=A0ABX8FGW7_9BACI|nr:DUF58 domain-containing protein [Cytobacillus gottheilii]QVY63260.1 DUF58 domain-containing protein [Cytobacillus gottheilii]